MELFRSMEPVKMRNLFFIRLAIRMRHGNRRFCQVSIPCEGLLAEAS